MILIGLMLSSVKFIRLLNDAENSNLVQLLINLAYNICKVEDESWILPMMKFSIVNSKNF